MFGIELSNSRGSTLLGEDETGFLYYGKLSITLQGSARLENSVYLNLFNLPSSAEITLFARSNGDGALLLLDRTTSILRLRCLANETQTVTVYVFVSAKYVPLPTWGVAIYRDNEVVWHTRRPPISFKEFRSHTDNDTALEYVYVDYPIAVPVGGTYMARFLVHGLPPGSGYDGYFYTFVAGVYGGRNFHALGVNRVMTSTGDFEGEVYTLNTIGIPLTYFTIDTSYYDRFTNLPNYV